MKGWEQVRRSRSHDSPEAGARKSSSLNMRTPERFFPCFESARDISMVAGSSVTKGLSRDQEERPTSICRKAQPQLPTSM